MSSRISILIAEERKDQKPFHFWSCEIFKYLKLNVQQTEGLNEQDKQQNRCDEFDHHNVQSLSADLKPPSQTSLITVLGFATQPIRMQVNSATNGMKQLLVI